MQPCLFSAGTPDFDPRFTGIQHTDLTAGAWIDHRPGWVSGHQALFDHLVATTAWRHGRRRMYDRFVAVPRLTARLPADGPGHPIIEALSSALSDRYRTELRSVALAYYRTGHDSVAWHGDRLENRRDSVIALVAVGEPRVFGMRPRGGGRSLRFRLGWGDLLVMGGTCQETWEHCLPKAVRGGARISIQFRQRGAVQSSQTRTDK